VTGTSSYLHVQILYIKSYCSFINSGNTFLKFTLNKFCFLLRQLLCVAFIYFAVCFQLKGVIFATAIEKLLNRNFHFHLNLKTPGFLSVPHRCSKGLSPGERGGCTSKTECRCFGVGSSLLKFVQICSYNLYNATSFDKLIPWGVCVILLVLKLVTIITHYKIFRLKLDMCELKFKINYVSILKSMQSLCLIVYVSLHVGWCFLWSWWTCFCR
jgi:hypothetical protein